MGTISRLLVSSVLAGSVVLAAAPGRADIPPPPDYVEQCARAKQEADDEYCELRTAYYADAFGCLAGEGNDPADPQACESAQAATDLDCCAGWIDDGWSYRCRTYGGSFWSAMWCRARQPGDPARPADDTEAESAGGGDGCSASQGSTGGAIDWLILLALGLGSLHYRRRGGKST